MAEPLSSLIRPEPAPSLPWLERIAPPPPQNLIAAEIEARTGPGDVVIDLHARGGWVSRNAVAKLRRGLAFESNPLSRLLAEVVLRPPELRALDAAVAVIGGLPTDETRVRTQIDALFSSRCATCARPVVVDEFIWDGAAGTPFRKSYRCAVCREQVGGADQRSAPTDDADRERAAASVPGLGEVEAVLRERIPVPEGGRGLVDELLALWTPRSLLGIGRILARLEADERPPAVSAALRLAFVHALLPSTRLSSYPGRVGALRIVHGHVRDPGERQWREHNPWHLFEEGARAVREFVRGLEASPTAGIQTRYASDLAGLVSGSGNVIVRPAPATPPIEAALLPPAEVADPVRARVRLVLTQPPARWTTDGLSFAYLATALILGREACLTLPLRPLFGTPLRLEWGTEAAGLRRSLAAVAPLLAPDARVVVMLDPGGPEGLVAAALGGVGAGYGLVSALLAEAGDEVGGTLEFVPPGRPRPGGPRTRANVPLPDDVADSAAFRLADVERDITDIAVAVLTARGEPVRFDRLLGEVLVGLDRRGHLRRLVGTRTYAETEARDERAADSLAASFAGRDEDADPTAADDTTSGEERPPRRPITGPGDSPVAGGTDQVGLLLELLTSELRRPDHPRLVELEPGRWWLRSGADAPRATLPLADRVEWAVFSLLSTSGGLSEAAFFDRIAGMFRGHETPDETLLRACLESYRAPAPPGAPLLSADDLQARSREHAELIGGIVEYGHRLGLRCWIGRGEQRRLYRGAPLASLLSEQEQRVYLPLVARGDTHALEETDVVWYLRGRATFLFEVEWTAMLTEPLLRRGPRIETDDTIVRFLVVLPERVELVRLKLERSPLLRRALEEGNWHILKADHLRTLLAQETADLDRFAPYLGLDPDVERQGEQLPLFG